MSETCGGEPVLLLGNICADIHCATDNADQGLPSTLTSA